MEPTEPCVKKRLQRLWNKDAMEKAIEAVRQKKMSVLKAAKTFQVPSSTLHRFAKSQLEPKVVMASKLGRKPIFGQDLEEKLLEYALMMKDKFYGITREDLQGMAYVFAKKQNKEEYFGSTMKAGRRWLDGFLVRHKNSIKCTSHSTDCFAKLEQSEESVIHFFNNLDQLYSRYQYPSDRIFNVDVTSLLVLQNKKPEVVISNDLKKNADLAATERKGLLTIVASMSASGFFVPPMLIFPEKNMKDELMNGAPPCSIGAIQPSGSVQNRLLTQWFTHFIKKVKPSEESPVLLIVDGQNSYVRNLEIVIMAEENHIELVSVIPSRKFEMQPMVETFVQPLKELYTEEVNKWSLENKRQIESSDLAKIFGRAYLKIKTGEVAVEGFRSTGIYPLDKTVLLERLQNKINSEKAVNEKEAITNKSNIVNKPIMLKLISPCSLVPGPSGVQQTKSSGLITVRKIIKSGSTPLPVTQVWLQSSHFTNETSLSQNTV